MKRASVIQLGKYYHPVAGGMETYLRSLCSRLRQSYDLSVLVANSAPRTVREKVDGVDVVRAATLGRAFSSSICPTMAYHLQSLIEKGSALIHIHLPNPMAHFAYLVARPRGKLIVTWHSDIVRQRWFLPFYKGPMLRLLQSADHIVATSKAYVESSPFLRLFREKCSVIPLGIDYDCFAQLNGLQPRVHRLRRRYGDRVVLFVGRLTYYKGVDVLLRAFERLDATLVLVGAGPQSNRIEQLIQSNGLRRRVHQLGQIDHAELVAHYHACDVFVLPSVHRAEAFGLVQLEAMAAGKPVVSTNLPTGVPWVNRDGVTGLVVEPGKPEALGFALQKLLDSPALRSRFGTNGQKRVRTEFTADLVARRTHELYQEALRS